MSPLYHIQFNAASSEQTVTLLEKLVENISVHMVGVYIFVQTKAVDHVARNGTIFCTECVM